MTDIIKEQISALVDDELADAESHLLLKRLGGDRDLRRCLERYYLISDALSNHVPDRVDPAFALRLKTVLEREPASGGGAVSTARLRALVKPLAGFAVAASVAVVAVFSVQSLTRDTGDTNMIAAGGSTSGERYIRDPDTRVTPDRERLEKRLNNYLVNHNEYAASNGMHGMLPYVRIVGYNSGQ
jgi:sigma-E factor negative regulatory protein RseA